MNRPTRITFILLGIAASVGLWSLVAARPQATLSSGCCGNIDKPITASPTPAPKKPLQEGYERIKCEKCGEVYDVPSVGCWRLLELEEIKHLHLSPQAEARMIKNFNARQEVVKYPRDLGDGVVQISENVTMKKEGDLLIYSIWKK